MAHLPNPRQTTVIAPKGASKAALETKPRHGRLIQMRFPVLLLVLASGLPFLHAAKKPVPPPDVLVVADVLAQDPDSVQPAPGKPVYYIFIGGMERDLGAPMGGMPSADATKMREEVVSALASRGFVQTKIGGPMPQIAIVYSWGYANLDTQDITETDSDSETGETTTSTAVFNGTEKANLVGVYKAQQHLLSASEAQDIRDAVQEDRLYITIGALDAKALRNKEKKLLWRTRMSVDARRRTLPETMNVMLASAAPFFAKDEAKPITVDEALRKEVHVKLGDIQFLGEVPAGPAPAKPAAK